MFDDKESTENKLNAIEMRMSKWMSGQTRVNIIKNTIISEKI